MSRWRHAGLLFVGVAVAACAAMPPEPARAAAAAASLAGTRWVGEVEGAADPRALPRLEFAAGGRLVGHTGCNALSGTWREEGGEVRFGPIAVTKRFCVDAAGAIEKRLLQALGESSRATREGAKLVVEAPGGARFAFSPAAAG